MDCTKIILASYSKLDALIKELDGRIVDKCVYSYKVRASCERIAEEVFKIAKRKQKLLELKRKVDVVFSVLSEEERDLLRLKYFNEKIGTKFDFSLRTYFRKQARLLKKLDEYFSFIGICDDHFFSTFKNDAFFASAKIKAEDVKRIACHFNDCSPSVKEKKTADEKLSA